MFLLGLLFLFCHRSHHIPNVVPIYIQGKSVSVLSFSHERSFLTKSYGRLIQLLKTWKGKAQVRVFLGNRLSDPTIPLVPIESFPHIPRKGRGGEEVFPIFFFWNFSNHRWTTTMTTDDRRPTTDEHYISCMYINIYTRWNKALFYFFLFSPTLAIEHSGVRTSRSTCRGELDSESYVQLSIPESHGVVRSRWRGYISFAQMGPK